jgi:alkanesulfonate monooxygenase SsuD/methylene tetrahydromethanopterin reductase-like flavin-dependent oxidoreductase (luciferase family)
MDYGLVLFTSDRGIAPAAAAKLADDHGFHTFYVPEHTHIPIKREAAHPTTGDESLPDDRYMRTLDPWVSLATAAAVTTKVRLSTAVALPVEHDCITLAKSIATLDHLSGGRLDVGVGSGVSPYELEFLGVEPANARAIYAEMLEVLTSALTTGRMSHRGEHLRDIDDVELSIDVLQKPLPPLWYASSNTRSAEWAAHNGFNFIGR